MNQYQGQMRYGMNQRARMQTRSYQGYPAGQNRQAANRTVTRPMQEERCSACEAENTKPEISQFPIAMAYVPWQSFETTYPLCQGLMVGTIFPELDLPFERGRCQNR